MSEEALQNAIDCQARTAYEVMDELAKNGFTNYQGTVPTSFEDDWRLGISNEEYSSIMEEVYNSPAMKDKTAEEILNTDIQPILREFGKSYSQTGYPSEDIDINALLSNHAKAAIGCERAGLNGRTSPKFDSRNMNNAAPSNGYDQLSPPTPVIDLEDTRKGHWI